MEEIIEEIWKNAQEFGWKAIESKKEYYLGLSKEYVAILLVDKYMMLHPEEIDVRDEVLVSEPVIKGATEVFECTDCGRAFNSRNQLHDHFRLCHITKITL